MRLALTAIAALFLLASPALGDVVYVPESPAGTDISSYAVGVDTIYLAVNRYTSTLTPPSAGTEERPIVWIGQGEGVTFAGIVPKSHNRFYNLTSTAGVTFPADGKHIMFDGCTLGGLNMMDADSSSVRNCTVRGTQFTVCRNLAAAATAADDTLEWCTFPSLTASGSFAIQFGMFNNGGGIQNYVRRFVRRFNTFTVSQSGSCGATMMKHWQTSDMLSYGNTWTLNSTATSAGNCEGDYVTVFRDSSYNLTMKRDVILVNNEGATISQNGFLTSSGGGGAYASSCYGYTIDSCYIRVFRGPAVFFQAQVPGLRMRNNVLRSRLSEALQLGSAFLAASNDPYIHHNTLMGKTAVYFAEEVNNGGGFSNNILWGTSTLPCNAYQAVGGTTGNVSAISDSNLVFSTTMDSQRALCKTNCAPPAAGPWTTTYSNDAHSVWADPQFADTSWFNLNVAPSASIAASSIFTLRYVGASAWPGGDDPWGPPAARKRPAYWGGDGD